MNDGTQWATDLIHTLLEDGPEVVLGLIVGNGPIHAGPVGLLWDDTATSLEVLQLAQTLGELGQTEHAIEALVLVAHTQWRRSAAA
jgi:hypothetical protein